METSGATNHSAARSERKIFAHALLLHEHKSHIVFLTARADSGIATTVAGFDPAVTHTLSFVVNTTAEKSIAIVVKVRRFIVFTVYAPKAWRWALCPRADRRGRTG